MQEQLGGQLAARQGQNHHTGTVLSWSSQSCSLPPYVQGLGDLPPLEQGSTFVLLKFHQVPVIQFFRTAALPSNISTGPPSMLSFAEI